MSERQPYSPNTWITGDIITAEKMNSIEQGIKNIEDDIYTGEGNLADQVKTMIEVNTTQPTSSYNKLWVQSTNEGGTLVPTEEEFEDVNDMLAETFATNKDYMLGDYVIYNNGDGKKLYRFITKHAAGAWNNGQVIEVTFGTEIKNDKQDVEAIKYGGKLINPLDIIQGSFNSSGVLTVNSTRIRNKDIIPVKKGGVIHFKPGTNTTLMLFGRFDVNKNYINDSPWVDKDTVIDWDGYAIIIYRNSSSTNITPIDYDAETIVTTQREETANFIMDSYGLPALSKPLLFTEHAYYFNKSSSSIYTELSPSNYFDGITNITNTGSGGDYALVREINEPQRIPRKSSASDVFYLAVYIVLADGVETSTDTWRLSSGGSWNYNTLNVAYCYNFVAKNGWNFIPFTPQSWVSNDPYRYVILALNSFANRLNYKSISIFSDINVAASQEINSVNSAGIVTENPISYGTSTFLTTLGATITGGFNGYTVTIPNATQDISGHVYGALNLPIKKYIGKGYVVDVYTERTDSTSLWSFNQAYISQSYSSWGVNAIQSVSAPKTYGFITYDLDSYNINPNDYSNIYLLITCYRYGITNGTKGNTLKLRYFLRSKTSYVIANRLLTEEQPDVDLLFWGDSLTAGAGGNGTTFPGVCATQLGGLYYKNCGVGGETANTIAARQGGNNIFIPAGAINGTYSMNSLEDIFGYHINPLRQGNGANSGDKIYINGQECTLTISQSSSTSSDATYTISGYTGETSVIPLLGKFVGSNFTGKIVVIFVGQNGATVGNDSSITARISIIDSMISHIGHTQYVIMGLTSGTESNRASEDAALLAKYGNKFFPTRKMLVNYGLVINGLTPTSQDTTDIAAGTVPTSLRSDGTHMNAYGYTAIGKLLADKIRSLGYV